MNECGLPIAEVGLGSSENDRKAECEFGDMLDPVELVTAHGVAHLDSSSSVSGSPKIAEAGEGSDSLSGGGGVPFAWHDTLAAKRILSRLAAADVSIVPETPIAGPRFFRWSAGAKHELLEDIRSEFIAERFGCDFMQACEQGRAREYLDLYNATPTVADALADRFGSPSRFGRPSERLIDCDRGAAANAAWQREQAATPAAKVA